MTFVEDLSDLVVEVVDDLYVRRFHRDRRRRRSGAPRRSAIGTAAVGNPLALPRAASSDSPGDETTTWAMRRRLAEAVAQGGRGSVSGEAG